MDRLISLEPSSTVAVRIEPGTKCFGVLTLRNVMYTMPVAFRLQAVNSTRYSVKPQSGIIPPLCTLTVEIAYHLPPGLAVPESFPRCHDSFLLHSVVVPGAAAKDGNSAVPTEWFTTRRKQVFVDSGIKVMFVGSPVIAQLVANGAMDEIREVLERSDPEWRAADSVDQHGQTLLHLAIAQGRADLVQMLLEFDPDIEAQSRAGAGSSPLEAAAASGEALIVEILLARRASSERSEGSMWGPIHVAAASGHVEVLKLLLRKGANVDSLTKDGNTALHLAVEERRRDCARLILAAGGTADLRSSGEGDTPLHVAAGMGDESMVKLLLQKGANKDIRNHAGMTAYDVAAEHGHARLFDALRLGDGLCAAARKGETRTVHKLLENGAAVNGRDQHGWTALHRASFKGRLDTVRTLIEKGIEVDAKDEDGYTALHCAAESGHVDVIELLIKKGADVEARTNKGVTGLQIAESLQYAGIARVLGYGGASKDGNAPVKMYGAGTVSFGDEKSKMKEAAPMKRRSGRGRAVRGGGFGQSLALAVL